MCACGRSSLLIRSASSRPASACLLFQLFALTTVGLLILGPSLSAGIPISEFFPFNSSFGDKTTNRKDDGGSGEIRLMVQFPFFGRHYNQVHVNNNGIITFDDHFSSYRPDDFPLKNNITMIAPFWADVDVNKSGGYIWYRQTREPSILAKAQKEIRNLLPAYRTFRAYWAFVATWDNVGFYGANDSGLTRKNTFQAVLILDYTGQIAFVILNYGRLQWTTGTNSRGNRTTGLGGAPAQAGFNAGNGVDYLELDGAQTAAVLNLTLTSNVGISGKWILRVDSRSTLNPCATTDIYFTPNHGTMMGGNMVSVSGSCIQSDLSVVGRIDETNDTFCCFTYEGQTQCIMPTVFQTGVFHVSLNVGNDGWNYTGQFEYKNIMDAQSGLVRVDPQAWQPGATVKLTIHNGSGLVMTSSYWVEFLEYTIENDVPKLQLITSTPKQGLKEDALISVTVPPALTISRLAVVRVRAALDFCQGEGPSIYSDVFPVNPTSPSQSEALCSSWLDSQKGSRPLLKPSGHCPCTLDQAEGDTGQYTADPLCYWDSKWPLNCQYRSQDAGECIIPNETSSDSGSYVCCYHKDSRELLNALDGRGGGTRERFSLRESSPDVQPYFTYLSRDIVPYRQCCLNLSNHTFCQRYLEHRPPVDCQGYETPAAAQASGDPHIETLDGHRYTFNGMGEFLLLRVKDSDAVVQVRTAPAVDIEGQSQNATVFTSIAFQAGNSSSIVEIRMDSTEDNLFSVFVDKEPVELTSSTSKFNGITVYTPVDESEDNGDNSRIPTTPTTTTTSTSTNTTTTLTNSSVTSASDTTTSEPSTIVPSARTPHTPSMATVGSSTEAIQSTQTQFETSAISSQLPTTSHTLQASEMSSSTPTTHPLSGHTGIFHIDSSTAGVLLQPTTLSTLFTHTLDVSTTHHIGVTTSCSHPMQMSTSTPASSTSTTTIAIMSTPTQTQQTTGSQHSSQPSSHSTTRMRRSPLGQMSSTTRYRVTVTRTSGHSTPPRSPSTNARSASLRTATRGTRGTSQYSSFRTNKHSTSNGLTMTSRQRFLSGRSMRPFGWATNRGYHYSTYPWTTHFRRRKSTRDLSSSHATYPPSTLRAHGATAQSSSRGNGVSFTSPSRSLSTRSLSTSVRTYGPLHSSVSSSYSSSPLATSWWTYFTSRPTSGRSYSSSHRLTFGKSYGSSRHSTSGRSYSSNHHSTSGRGHSSNHRSTDGRSYSSNHHSTSGRGHSSNHRSTDGRSYSSNHHSTSGRSHRSKHGSTSGRSHSSSPRSPSGRSYSSNHHSTPGRSHSSNHRSTSGRSHSSSPRSSSGRSHSSNHRSTYGRSYSSSPRPTSHKSHSASPRSTYGRTYSSSPGSIYGRTYTSSPRSLSGRTYNVGPRLMSRGSHSTSKRTRKYSTHSSATFSSTRTTPVLPSQSYGSFPLSTTNSYSKHPLSTFRNYGTHPRSWNFVTPQHSTTVFRLRRHARLPAGQEKISVHYADRGAAWDQGQGDPQVFPSNLPEFEVQSENLIQRMDKKEYHVIPRNSWPRSRPLRFTFTVSYKNRKASGTDSVHINDFDGTSGNFIHSDVVSKIPKDNNGNIKRNNDDDNRNLMDKNRNMIHMVEGSADGGENEDYTRKNSSNSNGVIGNGGSLSDLLSGASLRLRRQRRDSDASVEDETKAAVQESVSSSQVTKKSKRSEVTVVMESLGLSVLIQVTPDLMNLLTVAAPNLKGRLEGLLGNYNGDSQDDFVSRQGNTLSPSASMRDVHENFGMSWAVDPSSSLFASDTPPLSSFNQEEGLLSSNSSQDAKSFMPVFIDEIQPPTITANYNSICGGNAQCDFDYHVTGREDIAVSTLDFSVMFEKRKQELQPVVRCPRPDAIPNGNRTVTGQKVQDTVTYQCYEDFQFANGSGVLTCLSSGKWDQSPPVCVKVLVTKDKFPLMYVAVIAAVAGFVVVFLFLLALVGLYRRCKREASKKAESSSDQDTAIELPTIFPISDIPSPVFENPSFMSSLQRLSEKGSFHIPRPTYVDPSIYSEYF